MRSICGADAGCLAINYQSFRPRGVWACPGPPGTGPRRARIKAHRLFYHSTLGLRVIKREREREVPGALLRPRGGRFLILVTRKPGEREFFIDNLLVRIHLIIEMSPVNLEPSFILVTPEPVQPGVPSSPHPCHVYSLSRARLLVILLRRRHQARLGQLRRHLQGLGSGDRGASPHHQTRRSRLLGLVGSRLGEPASEPLHISMSLSPQPSTLNPQVLDTQKATAFAMGHHPRLGAGSRLQVD